MRGGIYWSGDLAYRDADGWFFFAGRSNEWLRVDGENFAAAPVERIVAAPSGGALGRGVRRARRSGRRPGDGRGRGRRRRRASTSPSSTSSCAAQPDLGPKWVPSFVRVDGRAAQAGEHEARQDAAASRRLERRRGQLATEARRTAAPDDARRRRRARPTWCRERDAPAAPTTKHEPTAHERAAGGRARLPGPARGDHRRRRPGVPAPRATARRRSRTSPRRSGSTGRRSTTTSRASTSCSGSPPAWPSSATSRSGTDRARATGTRPSKMAEIVSELLDSYTEHRLPVHVHLPAGRRERDHRRLRRPVGAGDERAQPALRAGDHRDDRGGRERRRLRARRPAARADQGRHRHGELDPPLVPGRRRAQRGGDRRHVRADLPPRSHDRTGDRR